MSDTTCPCPKATFVAVREDPASGRLLSWAGYVRNWDNWVGGLGGELGEMVLVHVRGHGGVLVD